MLLFCTPPVDIYGRSLLRVKQCGGGGEGCRGVAGSSQGEFV